MMHENEMISKELEEYLSHLSIFSEETKNEVKAKPEKCACCCHEEFLEIEIESEDECTKQREKITLLMNSFVFFSNNTNLIVMLVFIFNMVSQG